VRPTGGIMAKKQTKPTVRKRFNYDARIVVIGTISLLLILTALWAGGNIADIFKGTSVSQKTSSPTGNVLENRDWWKWMPGTEWSSGKLKVLPLNFALVNQDGTGEKPNYPINLYGMHAKAAGDFGISAAMESLTANPAMLQFYGEVPIVADEFRIERKSVRMTVKGDVLRAELWDGTSQDPSITREYSIELAQKHEVAMDRQGEFLIFTVDGRQVGTIQERDIFKGGKIWVGTGAQDESWQLEYLRLHAKGRGTLALEDSSTLKIQRQEAGGLQKLAGRKRQGFLVGSTTAIGPATTDEAYFKRVFGGDFGILTPENEMKMVNLQPSRGFYDFKKADSLVDLAKKHGIAVHGHALVFGEANPPWFNNLPVNDESEKEEIKNIMTTHIQKTMTRYKGKIKSWDVINEPLKDNGQANGKNGKAVFRPHKWHQAMGPEYIPIALEAAHKADPDALLFINEYGLEQDGERWDSFLAYLLQLKPQLEAKGIPVKKVGVGFQAHEYDRRDRIDTDDLEDHIVTLEEIGFKVRISEMDVDLQDGQRVAAEEYAGVAETCVDSEACVAWSVWMPTSAYNYFMTHKGEIKKGAEGLFDDRMQPTAAIAEVKNMLE
jgi:endo-1,4-beta-xylanase